MDESCSLKAFKSVPLNSFVTKSEFPDAKLSSVCDTATTKQQHTTSHRLQSIVSNIWCKTLAQEVALPSECAHQDNCADSLSNAVQGTVTSDEYEEAQRGSYVQRTAASSLLHENLTDPVTETQSERVSCTADSRCDTMDEDLPAFSNIASQSADSSHEYMMYKWLFEQEPHASNGQHDRSHVRLFVCEMCNKSFNWQSGLARHRRVKHAGELLYKCHICGMEFSRPDGLVEHRRVHRDEKRHSCDMCDKSFAYSSHLARHRVIHTVDVKPIACDNMFGQSDELGRHVCAGTGADQYSDISGHSFSRNENLTMTEQNLNVSDHCDTTGDSGDLVKHKGNQTGQLTLWKCSICSREFRSASKLSAHKRTHIGEKPYRCDTCFKDFSRLAHLTQHQRVHSGDRPFKCEMCTKSFTLLGTLVEHKRLHTGEKPYKCDMCDVAFSRRHYLKSHQRVHASDRPFQCYICNMAFNRPQNLTMHIRVHIGEKAYQCEICDKRFTRPSGLSNHRRNVRQCRPKSTSGTTFASSSETSV